MSKRLVCSTIAIPMFMLLVQPGSSETFGSIKNNRTELGLLTLPQENGDQLRNKGLQTITCNPVEARDCQSRLNDCLEECIAGRPDPKCQQACISEMQECKRAAGC